MGLIRAWTMGDSLVVFNTTGFLILDLKQYDLRGFAKSN